MFKVLVQVVIKLVLHFYELNLLIKNESENQQLSCNLHDKPFLWYVFHRCTPVGISTVCLCRMVLVVSKILSTSPTYRKMHLVQHASFFMILGNLENILKILKIRTVCPSFGQSGRRPSSGDVLHVEGTRSSARTIFLRLHARSC